MQIFNQPCFANNMMVLDFSKVYNGTGHPIDYYGRTNLSSHEDRSHRTILDSPRETLPEPILIEQKKPLYVQNKPYSIELDGITIAFDNIVSIDINDPVLNEYDWIICSKYFAECCIRKRVHPFIRGKLLTSDPLYSSDGIRLGAIRFRKVDNIHYLEYLCAIEEYVARGCPFTPNLQDVRQSISSAKADLQINPQWQNNPNNWQINRLEQWVDFLSTTVPVLKSLHPNKI